MRHNLLLLICVFTHFENLEKLIESNPKSVRIEKQIRVLYTPRVHFAKLFLKRPAIAHTNPVDIIETILLYYVRLEDSI